MVFSDSDDPLFSKSDHFNRPADEFAILGDTVVPITFPSSPSKHPTVETPPPLSEVEPPTPVAEEVEKVEVRTMSNEEMSVPQDSEDDWDHVSGEVKEEDDEPNIAIENQLRIKEQSAKAIEMLTDNMLTTVWQTCSRNSYGEHVVGCCGMQLSIDSKRNCFRRILHSSNALKWFTVQKAADS
jgi:hypothetical protein